MGSSFVKPKKSNIRGEWQKNTDEWWQQCWKPLWSSRTPSVKPRFMFCLLALFSYIYGIKLNVLKYDVYSVSAAWALLLLALGVSWVFPNSGPLSPLWPSSQVGLRGISRDLKRMVQSATWQIRLSSDWGLRLSPSEGSSGTPSVRGFLQLRLFALWPRVEVLSRGYRTDRRGLGSEGMFARCDVAASGLGAWRLRGLARGLMQTKPARQAEHAPSIIICLVTAVCVTLNPGTKRRLYSAHT